MCKTFLFCTLLECLVYTRSKTVNFLFYIDSCQDWAIRHINFDGSCWGGAVQCKSRLDTMLYTCYLENFLKLHYTIWIMKRLTSSPLSMNLTSDLENHLDLSTCNMQHIFQVWSTHPFCLSLYLVHKINLYICALINLIWNWPSTSSLVNQKGFKVSLLGAKWSNYMYMQWFGLYIHKVIYIQVVI